MSRMIAIDGVDRGGDAFVVLLNLDNVLMAKAYESGHIRETMVTMINGRDVFVPMPFERFRELINE